MQRELVNLKNVCKLLNKTTDEILKKVDFWKIVIFIDCEDLKKDGFNIKPNYEYLQSYLDGNGNVIYDKLINMHRDLIKKDGDKIMIDLRIALKMVKLK